MLLPNFNRKVYKLLFYRSRSHFPAVHYFMYLSGSDFVNAQIWCFGRIQLWSLYEKKKLQCKKLDPNFQINLGRAGFKKLITDVVEAILESVIRCHRD